MTSYILDETYENLKMFVNTTPIILKYVQKLQKNVFEKLWRKGYFRKKMFTLRKRKRAGVNNEVNSFFWLFLTV